MRAGGSCSHQPSAISLPLAVLVVSLGGAPAVSAQVRASELGSVSQVIDGTRISIEYSRPRARGRQDLFGGEVKWQEVWTPGANFATTLELSRNVKIEGHAVPKGKYSVWMVVRPGGDWTFVLDQRHRVYHMAHLDSTPAQIRFPVKALPAPFTEVLTWSFPENRASGATMVMSWGAIRVPVDVTVEPSYRIATPVADAAPYVGRYEFRWGDMPDTAKSLELIVAYRDSMLTMRFEPTDPYYEGAALIRIKEDWFIPGIFENGQFIDALRDMVLEFKVAAGKAVGFEVRGDADELWAKGVRKKDGRF
jgi:DUF2911 family protein